MKLLYVLLIVVFQLIDQSITTSDLDCSFSLFIYIYILFIVLIANLCCYKMIIIIRNAYERERERGREIRERVLYT